MHSHINLAPTQDENRMCLNSDRIERGRQRDRRPKRDDSKDWLRESEQSKVKNFGRRHILILTSKWPSELLEPEEWEAYCTLNSRWSDNKTWVHPAGAPPQADLEGRDQERQGRLLGLHLALPRQRRQDALRVPRPRHRVRQEVAGAPGRSAHTSLIKAELSNLCAGGAVAGREAGEQSGPLQAGLLPRRRRPRPHVGQALLSGELAGCVKIVRQSMPSQRAFDQEMKS